MMPGVRRSCCACRHCRCRMQFSTPGHMKRSPGSPRRFTRRNRLQRQIRPITRWSLFLLGLEADHVFDAVAQPILRIVVGSCVLSALRVDCAVIWQPSAGTRERALRLVRCCRLVADPRVAVTRPAAAVARPAVPREGRGLDRPVGRGRGQAFPVDRSEEDQSQQTTGTRKEEDPVDERSIRLENWKRTLEMSIRCSTPINPEALQEKYEDVFSDQLGEIRGIEADIELDDNARPRFFRSRPVPFPLREKVNQELDRQLEEGARGQPRTTAQSPSAVRCAAAPREVPLLPEVCGVLGIHSHHRGSATERKEAQVASATAKDPVLSVVLGWARTGAWPGHANDSRLKPYLQRREQLTVIDGCVQLELPGSARYSSPSDTAVPPSVKRAGGVSGQPVLVRDLRPAATEKWQRAVVVAIGGPLTYSVRLPDGRIRLAHVDHLLADGSASVTAERGPLDARVTVPPPTEPGKLRGPAVPCVMDARGRFPYISDYNKRATCEGNRGARASEPVEAAPALRRSARLAKKTC
ncbi:uncharacterized protein LOC122393776 isoform X3 [Amphibalanus amphitrite]|uniref:uncharacterized protein LOC122393776 isoform X3 n=1 Tax=Amphibalanus amphitrite TaxID=1232801 RepID=UPI001C919370|nr:uncharacterized protein LOC122393776 isoform X3 [Amphibalanus amphitrite]